MVIVMILIAAFSCGFVYAFYGVDALMVALPPYVLAIVATILIGAIAGRLNSKTKTTAAEEKARRTAYNAEYKKINVEQEQKRAAANAVVADTNQRMASLKAKKEDAEGKLKKVNIELNAAEQIPEFYMNREHLEKISGYLTNSLADSLQSAFFMFEQHRRAELLSDLQRSEQELQKAKDEEKLYKRVRLQLDYEDYKVDQKYNEIKSEISYNVGRANDLIDEADSARRARR